MTPCNVETRKDGTATLLILVGGGKVAGRYTASKEAGPVRPFRPYGISFELQ
jgi:methylmalonyl-CoA mutase cobalamin-binding subunit